MRKGGYVEDPSLIISVFNQLRRSAFQDRNFSKSSGGGRSTDAPRPNLSEDCLSVEESGCWFHHQHLCGRAMPLFSRMNSWLLIRTVSVRSVLGEPFTLTARVVERAGHAFLLVSRNAVGCRDISPMGDYPNEEVDDLFGPPVLDSKIGGDLPCQF